MIQFIVLRIQEPCIVRRSVRFRRTGSLGKLSSFISTVSSRITIGQFIAGSFWSASQSAAVFCPNSIATPTEPKDTQICR